MITHAYSLFDTKTATYAQPFFFNHIAQATRALADLVNDPGTLPGKYPADYQLHELGLFDDQTGEFRQGFNNHGSLVQFVRATPAMPLFQPQEA